MNGALDPITLGNISFGFDFKVCAREAKLNGRNMIFPKAIYGI